jgi:nonribosomal peptide synthetase MxcG
MTEVAPSAAGLPELVVEIAGEVLGETGLSPGSDFFSAGGDSLLAMHLVSRVARATGLRVRVRLLIANPVLGDFAAAVAQLAEESGKSVGLPSAG